MKLSSLLGSTAFVLGGALAAAPAFGEPRIQMPAAVVETAQEKLAQRETLRRAAVVEHQKRQEDFALRCVKRDRSGSELQACRDAYRKLYSPTSPPTF